MSPKAPDGPMAALINAGGENAFIALASVDIAFPELDNQDKLTLKMALVAAAVPHWFDEKILSTLLATTARDASTVLSRLAKLNIVEDFPSRGTHAFNVHNEFRSSIRKYLRENSRREWDLFSRRAADSFDSDTDSVGATEHVYHVFGYDAEAAIVLARDLDRSLTIAGKLDSRFQLASWMRELVVEGSVENKARIEASLISLSFDGYRSSVQNSVGAARTLLKEAQAIDYKHGIERATLILGDALRETGKYSAAASAYKQAYAIAKDELEVAGDNRHWAHRLGVASSRIAQLAKSGGNIDDAIDAAYSYLSLAEFQHVQLGVDEESFGLRRLGLANVQLGSALEYAGKNEDAVRYFARGLEIIESLAKRDPGNLELLRDLAVAYSRAAGLEEACSRIDNARRYFEMDLSISRRLVALDGGNLRWKHDLTISLGRIGKILEKCGELNEALAAYEERRALLSRLLDENPLNIDWRRSHVSTLRAFGSVYSQMDRLEDALNASLEACDLARSIVQWEPESGSSLRDLAVSYRQLGDVLSQVPNHEAALKAFFEYLGAASQAVATQDHPPPDWIRGEAAAYAAVAETFKKLDRIDDSNEYLARAVAVMERACAVSERRAWLDELEALRRGEFQ